MRLLLDTCVAVSVARELAERARGEHDVEWCGDWPADPGDAKILVAARRTGRVVVTLDRDFPALAIVRGQPHAGIVRLVDLPLSKQVGAILGVLRNHGTELVTGAIVTAEPGRVRLRRPV